MMINALNSGARIFMCCLEDALAPSWENICTGHDAIRRAIRGTLSFTSPEGKEYRLGERPATLDIRPRGWHLEERHVLVDGAPVSASLFDATLLLLGSGKEMVARGSGPFLYLPKPRRRRSAEFRTTSLFHPRGDRRYPWQGSFGARDRPKGRRSSRRSRPEEILGCAAPCEKQASTLASAHRHLLRHQEAPRKTLKRCRRTAPYDR